MIIALVVLGLAVWYTLGIWAEGYFFAYSQRAFPMLALQGYDEDRKRALIMAFGGPLNFPGSCAHYTYGRGTSFGWMNPFRKTMPEADKQRAENAVMEFLREGLKG